MSSSAISLTDLVSFLARTLVDQPDEVQVSQVNGRQAIVVELKVAKEDVGKVIGKHGRTVKAIRSLLSVAAAKINKRADLEILE